MKNKSFIPSSTLVTHPIEPFFDRDSRILILGSFPSVQSRKDCFYYAHPRNRFWRVLSSVFNESIPSSVKEKMMFLSRHNIALYDVVFSCRIHASGDQSIRDVVPTDLRVILDQCNIDCIVCNGKTAGRLYDKYHYPATRIKAMILPSTSPANASFSENSLRDAWRVIQNQKRN